MDKIKITKFIISILICQIAGLIGAVFTTPSITTWYAGIVKPAFNPPNWIFAPVWTTLFILMGISFYLIWEKGLDKKNVKLGISIFGVQLILNILWSVIFFGFQNPLLGLIEIIALWIAILVNIILFYKISRTGAYLLIPYILWVSIATFLNYSIYILNM
jgi:tryptophan-rich sensory protein